MSLLLLSKREDTIITAFLTEVEWYTLPLLDSISDYEFKQFLMYEDYYASLGYCDSPYGTYEFKLDNTTAIGNSCNPEIVKDIAISVASKDAPSGDIISNIIHTKAWWGLFGTSQTCSFRLSEWDNTGKLISNNINRIKLRWINKQIEH
tara:strand:+ start:1843 stop:2289 length:447 start_codon:yes stop_codon:yes gene_type:complete